MEEPILIEKNEETRIPAITTPQIKVLNKETEFTTETNDAERILTGTKENRFWYNEQIIL